MKTPREILLQRHQAAGPRLDTLRRAVLGNLHNEETRKQRMSLVAWLLGCLVAWLLGCSKTFWRELIWPSRRLWTGIGAAWVVIVTVNLHEVRTTALASQPFTPPSPAVLMAWREQERWLTDFAEPREAPRDAVRPKKTAPLPRSQWQGELFHT